MFVHWLDFPVVEIRTPSASQGTMLVYDRTGTTVIDKLFFPVSQVREKMSRRTKNRLREENVTELQAIIARNKRRLLSRDLGR